MARNTLYGAARQLAQHMSDISEDVYSAGWIQNNEWILWRALLDWRKTGRAHWDPKQPQFGDITEYMPELDRLQREAGGWVWWLNPGGETFVPDARWLAIVQRRGELPSQPDNEALHEALPPLQFVPRSSSGEPLCCDQPMVHNSFTGEYECADAYFGLVDDGVLVDSFLAVDDKDLTDEQRTQYEHWRMSCVSDLPPVITAS